MSPLNSVIKSIQCDLYPSANDKGQINSHTCKLCLHLERSRAGVTDHGICTANTCISKCIFMMCLKGKVPCIDCRLDCPFAFCFAPSRCTASSIRLQSYKEDSVARLLSLPRAILKLISVLMRLSSREMN